MWSALARLIQALVTLVALVAAAAGFGVFLLWVDGPPHLPALPPPAQFPLILQLEGVPPAAIRYTAATAGWAVLAYVVVGLLTAALATLLETVAAGTGGVRHLRRAADRLAPGVVRRLGGGVAAALLTAWMALRPPLSVAAQPTRDAVARIVAHPVPAPPVAAGAGPAGGAPAASVPAEQLMRPSERRSTAAPVRDLAAGVAPTPQVMVVGPTGEMRPLMQAMTAPADESGRYIVVSGDNLWWIALKVWGDAALWPELWRANEDRVMPGGHRLVDPGRLRPGDVLVVPPRDCARPCALVEHVVREGETLGRIARRYLGDPARAEVIFRANRGIQAPNGRHLTDPDTIWPGMTLRIPRPVAVTADAAAPDHRPAAPAIAPVEVAPATLAAAPPNGRSLAERRAARLQRQAEAEAAAEVAAIARRAAAALVGQGEVPAGAAELPTAPSPSVGGPLPEERPVATPVPAAQSSAPAAPGGEALGDETTEATEGVSAPAPPRTDEPDYAGLVAGVVLGLLTAAGGGWWATDRLHRRRALVGRPADERVLPLHFARVESGDTDGSVARPLAAQAAQRGAGLETDDRAVLTEGLLTALAAAGYPEASIVLMLGDGRRATYQVRLGGPAPAEPAALAEALEERLASPVDIAPRAGDEVALTLADVHVDERWAVRPPAPRAPLLELGLAADGVLSVGLEGLDGGLLVAGADAPMVLQHGLLGLAGLCRRDDLRLALLAGEPLAGWLRGLPHLLAPPGSADGAAADRLLLGLHEELRLRQAGDERAGTDWLVLVIDGPPAAGRLAELRDLARDGARVGIGVIAAAGAGGEIDGGLLDACRGRLLTSGLDEATSARLAGQPGAAALTPGTSWWLRPGEGPLALRSFRIEPEERQAVLAALRAAAGESASAPPDGGASAQPARPVIAVEAVGGPGRPESAPAAAVAATAAPSGGERGAARPVRRPTRAPVVAARAEPVPGTPLPDLLVVRVFGVPAVSFGGKEVPISRPTVLEHLCYLALHEAHECDAESLLEALRGERGLPSSGVRAIHSSTGRLRDALRPFLPANAPDPIVHQGGGFALNPASVWTDRRAFDRLVAAAGPVPEAEALPLLRAALALYRGPVCQGHRFGWVGPVRERYQEVARDEVALAAAAAEARAGRLREAIDIYQALRRADVLDDVLIQREMLCWARLGDVGALTAAFESWRKQLELTAEMRPMRRTAELYAKLAHDPGAAAGETGREGERASALVG